MKDRLSEFPARRKLHPVTGQPNVYDVEMLEGEVYEEGTPFNTNSMLKDSTAEMLGLDHTATPNQAFEKLALLKSNYGISSTAGNTLTKSVAMLNFQKENNPIFSVKFDNANTRVSNADVLKLDVNSTGATEIRVDGQPLSTTQKYWLKGTQTFQFDGTYYHWINGNSYSNLPFEAYTVPATGQAGWTGSWSVEKYKTHEGIRVKSTLFFTVAASSSAGAGLAVTAKLPSKADISKPFCVITEIGVVGSNTPKNYGPNASLISTGIDVTTGYTVQTAVTNARFCYTASADYIEL